MSKEIYKKRFAKLQKEFNLAESSFVYDEILGMPYIKFKSGIVPMYYQMHEIRSRIIYHQKTVKNP